MTAGLSAVGVAGGASPEPPASMAAPSPAAAAMPSTTRRAAFMMTPERDGPWNEGSVLRRVWIENRQFMVNKESTGRLGVKFT
ncbi:hypothetical protein GCM10008179_02500 [Hansschlegelia plantiphila]|uniref:Uncharacterized protein n=1 Tax=Hansschlegelia plantiphila TaxID=374655 RepID=A0A9W6MU60_9HYPH|nr:hypothetical protein GCM10008179_02500 [Hansschlegelia plantiphila]